MTIFKKIGAAVLATVLCVSLFAGCEDENGTLAGSTTAAPQGAATAKPDSANDAAATVEYVAKVGTQEIYSCEFYFALYSAISEVYYGAMGEDSEIYDESLTDEENYQKMLDFLHAETGDGRTNLDTVIDKALDISARFRVASALGKQEADSNKDYAISQETIDENLEYIDEEAEYGSSYYEMTRDDYYFYVYGMNVNEAKRYTEAQLYAQVHREAWAEENGYVLGATEPEEPIEPEKPEDISENASDAVKAEYEEAMEEYEEELEKYNEEYPEYEKELAEYEAAYNEYWEKFRAAYEAGKGEDGTNEYDVVTIRYLYLSTLDEDGKALSDDKKAEKKTLAEKYMNVIETNGLDFEKFVLGFSESTTVLQDFGLLDITAIADFTDSAMEWAVKASTPISDNIELFESDDGYYLVQKVGVTDFDKTEGIVASEADTSHDTVKATVEYDMLTELYNKVIDAAMETDEFVISEINTEAMRQLAEKYIENSDEENA